MVKLQNTALDTLAAWNANNYPNVHKFLTILATIPMTTTTAERSFSTLRRLKTRPIHMIDHDGRQTDISGSKVYFIFKIMFIVLSTRSFADLLGIEACELHTLV